MATFYVDLENGSDANNGTTFALRKKTLPSVTAATAGDTIRVMGSPAATSLGQTATWSNRNFNQFNISSSTNATPISITTNAAHGFATGDTVTITAHTVNTNANGTWKITVTGASTFTLNTSVGTAVGGATGTANNITGKTVELSSAVTQTIISTGGSGASGGNRTAWVGSTNVTVTQQSGSTIAKESNMADQISVLAAFGTGIIAYRALPATLNLSGYQQINFWIQQTSGTLVTADNLRLRLCSDSVGNTVVNTANIPAIQALNVWVPVTVDLATNLGSSINSVSLQIQTTDQGAQVFRICNVFASKASSSADSLTLQSLIGKNDGMWYHIQSIDGTRVILDSGSLSYPIPQNTRHRYTGTSESVTTYKKETIKISSEVVAPTGNGTAGNLLNVTGGWNRTDMSTQTLETWIDGQYQSSPLLRIQNKNYLLFQNFSVSRGRTQNISFSGNTYGDYDFNVITCSTVTNAVDFTTGNVGNVFSVANLEFNTGWGFQAANVNNKSNNLAFGVVATNTTGGLQIADIGTTVSSITRIESNGASGLDIGGSNNVFESITEIKNNAAAINFAAAATIGGSNGTRIENLGTISNNGTIAFNNVGYGTVYVANGSTSGHTSTVVTQTGGGAPIYFKNVTFNEATSLWYLRNYNLGDNFIYMDNNNGVDYTFGEFGYIASDTTTRHTASGKSWAFYPTNASRNFSYPLRLNVAQAAVEANAEVTVSAWLRRNTTNLQMRLQVVGGQLAGVTKTGSDLTAAIDTWQEVTITFTPTEAGVVNIECIAWTDSGTTNIGYIDDLTITQA